MIRDVEGNFSNTGGLPPAGSTAAAGGATGAAKSGTPPPAYTPGGSPGGSGPSYSYTGGSSSSTSNTSYTDPVTGVTYSSQSDDPMIQKLSALGIPTNQQGETFYQEEEDLGHATSTDPFAGWSFPKGVSGNDFWQMYTMAEKFAANAGWKELPTPAMITQAIQSGLLQKNETDIYGFFATKTGISQTEPWAIYGMNKTQWDKASASLDEMSQNLLGKNWDAAGLDPALKGQALQNGWGESDVRSHLVSSGFAQGTYGYLRHNMSYQDFQNYKSQNLDQLRSRYGANYSDIQANENLDNPLFAFHAAGASVQQQQAPQGQQLAGQSQSEVR